MAIVYPPLYHPVIDETSRLMTRPWVLWVQQQTEIAAVPADLIQIGTRAAQPAATSVVAGTLYAVSDESIIERSDGTSWVLYR